MASKVPPQYQGNDSNEALVAVTVFFVVDVVVLTARAIAKFLVKSAAGWDDWLLIPTALLNFGLCGITFYSAQYGTIGVHQKALEIEDPSEVIVGNKLQVLFINFYAYSAMFPKLVLLNLYLRIFETRQLRRATYVLLGFCTAQIVISIICNQTMCIPLNAMWDPTVTDAKCFNLPPYFAYSTIPNIFFDVLVLALPIPTLLALHLPLRDRIGLVLTFTSGGIGILGGIARIIMNVEFNGMEDPTWTSVPLTIVATLECTLYLVACCLPGLRPLYAIVFSKGQFSKKPSQYYGDASGMPMARKSGSMSTPRHATSNPSMLGHESLHSGEYSREEAWTAHEATALPPAPREFPLYSTPPKASL